MRGNPPCQNYSFHTRSIDISRTGNIRVWFVRYSVWTCVWAVVGWDYLCKLKIKRLIPKPYDHYQILHFPAFSIEHYPRGRMHVNFTVQYNYFYTWTNGFVWHTQTRQMFRSFFYSAPLGSYFQLLSEPGNLQNLLSYAFFYPFPYLSYPWKHKCYTFQFLHWTP